MHLYRLKSFAYVQLPTLRRTITIAFRVTYQGTVRLQDTGVWARAAVICQ